METVQLSDQELLAALAEYQPSTRPLLGYPDFYGRERRELYLIQTYECAAAAYAGNFVDIDDYIGQLQRLKAGQHPYFRGLNIDFELLRKKICYTVICRAVQRMADSPDICAQIRSSSEFADPETCIATAIELEADLKAAWCAELYRWIMGSKDDISEKLTSAGLYAP